MDAPISECPTPRKAQFERRAKAERSAFLVGAKNGVRLYVYRCPCGYWHLTRRAPRKNLKRKER